MSLHQFISKILANPCKQCITSQLNLQVRAEEDTEEDEEKDAEEKDDGEDEETFVRTSFMCIIITIINKLYTVVLDYSINDASVRVPSLGHGCVRRSAGMTGGGSASPHHIRDEAAAVGIVMFPGPTILSCGWITCIPSAQW